MHKRNFMLGCSLAAASLLAGSAMAQDNTFKIGLIAPLTGPFASTGKIQKFQLRERARSSSAIE